MYAREDESVRLKRQNPTEENGQKDKSEERRDEEKGGERE